MLIWDTDGLREATPAEEARIYARRAAREPSYRRAARLMRRARRAARRGRAA